MLEYSRKDAKAWATEKVKGFYMCPISPVGDDFQFDYPKLRENIDKPGTAAGYHRGQAGQL